MAIAISLYNGFNIGLERTINKPMWGIASDGDWDVILFSGMVFHIGCFRISWGDFYEVEVLEIEKEE